MTPLTVGVMFSSAVNICYAQTTRKCNSVTQQTYLHVHCRCLSSQQIKPDLHNLEDHVGRITCWVSEAICWAAVLN